MASLIPVTHRLFLFYTVSIVACCNYFVTQAAQSWGRVVSYLVPLLDLCQFPTTLDGTVATESTLRRAMGSRIVGVYVTYCAFVRNCG